MGLFPATTPKLAVVSDTESRNPGQTGAAQALVRAVPALSLLLEAYEYAAELGRPAWDFAMEMDALCVEGLTVNLLRWLVCKGYAEHGREVTAYGEAARSFQRSPGLRFSKHTSFVLTPAGVEFSRHVLSDSRRHAGVAPAEKEKRSAPLGTPMTPTWDCERQELRVGAVVVKRFKVPAVNQQTILAAFQEEGWPARIDDPLPPRPDQDPSRRLHDTITSLNRNQKEPLVRFRGDGSGEGILWEFASAEPAQSGPDGLHERSAEAKIPR